MVYIRGGSQREGVLSSGGGGVQQGNQTGREVTFQSDGVNGLGLDDGAGMQSDRASVTLSITLSCHLYTIFLAALGPPWAALRARKSEIGIARRPVILRSRLWAVARHLMGVEETGQAVVHAWTSGCAGEQCAMYPWTLMLCLREQWGQGVGGTSSFQKVA